MTPFAYTTRFDRWFGSILLLAALTALPVCGTGAFSIPPSAATSISIVQGDGQTGPAGAALPLTLAVDVRDAVGLPAQGVAVTFAIAQGGGSLAPAVALTDALGLGETTYTLGGTAGPASVTASVAGLPSVTFSATIAAAAPVQLVFRAAPAAATATVAMTPPVDVAIEDAFGNTVPVAEPITIALGVNPVAGTLAGTLTRTTSSGVASFDDLAIDAAGSGYTLIAQHAALPTIECAPFDVAYSSAPFDFNGDTYPDFVVGSPFANAGGLTEAGRAHLYFGGPGLPTTFGAHYADVAFTGDIAGEHFGIAVAGIGDWNGDGLSDIAIARTHYTFLTPTGQPSAAPDEGAVYLFFGRPSPPAVLTAGQADVVLLGETIGDEFGWSLASAGDINGDGLADVIIGARAYKPASRGKTGAAYVFFGRTAPPATLSATQADITLTGDAAGDQFGYSVAAADINGDGFDDMIIGALLNDIAGSGAGATHLFLGSAAPLSLLDARTDCHTIHGEFSQDQLGTSVANAGDINGDGFEDVLVGARRNDRSGSDNGCAYVILGRATGFTAGGLTPAWSADSILIGEPNPGNFGLFGGAVAGAGDINGDGFDDVLVGASFMNINGMNVAGRAYVFHGSATPAQWVDAAMAETIVSGTQAKAWVGQSVAPLGDVDGDGLPDMIIGAPGTDGGGTDAGAIYILRGATSARGAITTGDTDFRLRGPSTNAQFGFSASR